MKSREWFAQISDHNLVEWWMQYGAPGQACHYPHLSGGRRRCAAEISQRSLWNEVEDQSEYRRSLGIKRPAGYLGRSDLRVLPNGWAFWWGLGAESAHTERLPLP